ncbi:hypothetical protein ES332_D05G284700v1 [Gossypium tomentosum]|uniref:Uncharacterized protein n=1 Tax=Gossypium tomentosum TaxID=34277 RepID=A0A5D2L1F2_GOSTO|nr:hypothetical protein ES332_D05G284700v1 [Gossypium tomentosum]
MALGRRRGKWATRPSHRSAPKLGQQPKGPRALDPSLETDSDDSKRSSDDGATGDSGVDADGVGGVVGWPTWQKARG